MFCVYFTNSNEIDELVKSKCWISVAPLEILDGRNVGEVFLFDMLFYWSPYCPWKDQQLLQKYPEWYRDIFPILNHKQHAYLFNYEWNIVLTVSKLNKVLFQRREALPTWRTVSERDYVRIAPTPQIWTRNGSETLKSPIDFDAPFQFKELCDKLEELV